ncbi:hypothetical protein P691DRAFT_834392, partial [Macrolepiota fuliginosa MF-IS2]
MTSVHSSNNMSTRHYAIYTLCTETNSHTTRLSPLTKKETLFQMDNESRKILCDCNQCSSMIRVAPSTRNTHLCKYGKPSLLSQTFAQFSGQSSNRPLDPSESSIPCKWSHGSKPSNKVKKQRITHVEGGDNDIEHGGEPQNEGAAGSQVLTPENLNFMCAASVEWTPHDGSNTQGLDPPPPPSPPPLLQAHDAGASHRHDFSTFQAPTNEIKVVLEFIKELQTASLDASGLDEDIIERLRNPRNMLADPPLPPGMKHGLETFIDVKNSAVTDLEDYVISRRILGQSLRIGHRWKAP